MFNNHCYCNTYALLSGTKVYILLAINSDIFNDIPSRESILLFSLTLLNNILKAK